MLESITCCRKDKKEQIPFDSCFSENFLLAKLSKDSPGESNSVLGTGLSSTAHPIKACL